VAVTRRSHARWFRDRSDHVGRPKSSRASASSGARPRLRIVLLALLLLGTGGFIATITTTSAKAAVLPNGFQESVIFSGLTQPTTVRFSPDGRVFVAEKRGIVKVFDSLSDTTPETFADLRTNVHNTGIVACWEWRSTRSFPPSHMST
jgi:hypothetical protein